MTPQNSLELQGTFLAFPLAELLVEIMQARLDGSLRFSHKDRKVIAYFRNGNLVYAVSNARSSRLFDILLREKKIDKKTLLQIPNFTSDIELSKVLIENKMFSEKEIDGFFSRQIEEFLRESLEWENGEWNFNPLARIREGISFEINLPKLLSEYSRDLSSETVISRFRSVQEKFIARPMATSQINLQPHEAFVLSRFSETEVTIEDIKLLSGMPDSATFQTLYTLWLGGFLIRKNWNSAFTERQIAHIKSADINLIKKDSAPIEAKIEPSKPVIEKSEEKTENTAETVEEEKITLEEYLAQVENSTNHYELLGVDLDASTEEIKKAYFKFAKQFHPDIFHRNAAPELHRQIQNAFTKIASAHETLRDKDLREIYDYKLRKEIAFMEERKAKGQAAGKTDLVDKEATAAEQFERGYNLLMDEYYEDAVPFLARAVHLNDKNARYRAFYGKALTFDESQRHKAESEIQTAIRLEPNNELYRIISAEFFIHHKLLKRAEGELKRLLAIAPNNREAQVLLDSLQNK